MRRRLFAVAGLLALLFAVSALPASAQITRNTFVPDATLAGDGRSAQLTVILGCEAPGETVSLLVIVKQHSTHAVAFGVAQAGCAVFDPQNPTDPPEAFIDVEVLAIGRPAVEAGDAEACAIALVRDGKRVVDARRWCAANGIELGAS